MKYLVFGFIILFCRQIDFSMCIRTDVLRIYFPEKIVYLLQRNITCWSLLLRSRKEYNKTLHKKSQFLLRQTLSRSFGFLYPFLVFFCLERIEKLIHLGFKLDGLHFLQLLTQPPLPFKHLFFLCCSSLSFWLNEKTAELLGL